jgi:hypothetical protein
LGAEKTAEPTPGGGEAIGIDPTVVLGRSFAFLG